MKTAIQNVEYMQMLHIPSTPRGEARLERAHIGKTERHRSSTAEKPERCVCGRLKEHCRTKMGFACQCGGRRC